MEERTWVTFQARLKASWMQVLEPRPLKGGWRWTASPRQKLNPTR